MRRAAFRQRRDLPCLRHHAARAAHRPADAVSPGIQPGRKRRVCPAQCPAHLHPVRRAARGRRALLHQLRRPRAGAACPGRYDAARIVSAEHVGPIRPRYLPALRQPAHARRALLHRLRYARARSAPGSDRLVWVCHRRCGFLAGDRPEAQAQKAPDRSAVRLCRAGRDRSGRGRHFCRPSGERPQHSRRRGCGSPPRALLHVF